MRWCDPTCQTEEGENVLVNADRIPGKLLHRVHIELLAVEQRKPILEMEVINPLGKKCTVPEGGGKDPGHMLSQHMLKLTDSISKGMINTTSPQRQYILEIFNTLMHSPPCMRALLL